MDHPSDRAANLRRAGAGAPRARADRVIELGNRIVQTLAQRGPLSVVEVASIVMSPRPVVRMRMEQLEMDGTIVEDGKATVSKRRLRVYRLADQELNLALLPEDSRARAARARAAGITILASSRRLSRAIESGAPPLGDFRRVNLSKINLKLDHDAWLKLNQLIDEFERHAQDISADAGDTVSVTLIVA